ncbi:hypothetical protein RJ639_045545 [Escallonia herrerae]|uniref:60S ribosomal export protein NMD3 n=1 Tax=Escallonia herrerae TaxID=1293975 RepID=A0AA89AZM2_9ASTE|nr:hypothetical protein RJ639_045545 [Escallonia herrerae]
MGRNQARNGRFGREHAALIGGGWRVEGLEKEREGVEIRLDAVKSHTKEDAEWGFIRMWSFALDVCFSNEGVPDEGLDSWMRKIEGKSSTLQDLAIGYPIEKTPEKIHVQTPSDYAFVRVLEFFPFLPELGFDEEAAGVSVIRSWCCECGTRIPASSANMCERCVWDVYRDITKDLANRVSVIHSLHQVRSLLQPPRTWSKAGPESRELMTCCLKSSKRLDRMNDFKIVTESFVSAEPEAKLIKVKVVIHEMVSEHLGVQKAYTVRYLVQDQILEIMLLAMIDLPRAEKYDAHDLEKDKDLVRVNVALIKRKQKGPEEARDGYKKDVRRV